MSDRKKLPPPWLRERDATELERELKHLARLRQAEANAIANGIQIRLKKPKEKRAADREEPVK